MNVRILTLTGDTARQDLTAMKISLAIVLAALPSALRAQETNRVRLIQSRR